MHFGQFSHFQYGGPPSKLFCGSRPIRLVVNSVPNLNDDLTDSSVTKSSWIWRFCVFSWQHFLSRTNFVLDSLGQNKSINNKTQQIRINTIFRSELKQLHLEKQQRRDPQMETLTEMFERISHHSLSTRFDMYLPFLGANQNKILRESSSKEHPARDIDEPFESGLKIPLPRLGWMAT